MGHRTARFEDLVGDLDKVRWPEVEASKVRE